MARAYAISKLNWIREQQRKLDQQVREVAREFKDLLDYVIVPEMAHLLEPNHGVRFIDILDRHCPTWRDARAELNDLPLGS